MNYNILTYYSATEMCDMVLKLIKEGWVPQGGIAIIPNGNSIIYSQAMIKYD